MRKAKTNNLKNTSPTTYSRGPRTEENSPENIRIHHQPGHSSNCYPRDSYGRFSHVYTLNLEARVATGSISSQCFSIHRNAKASKSIKLRSWSVLRKLRSSRPQGQFISMGIRPCCEAYARINVTQGPRATQDF